MPSIGTGRPVGWWLVSAIATISAAATVLLMAAAALSLAFADQGLKLVKQHFGEPASVYPAGEVAGFILMSAVMMGLASAYCWVLARLVLPSARTSPTRSLKALAWLMLAMHIALFPLGNAALAVETAFKGPTSEVVMAYEIIAFLALLTMFALAQAWPFHENPHGVRDIAT